MDQGALQQHLAQAERHIARGVVHLARQRELIAELDRTGHDTEEARAILDTLMETQVLHQQDRERLLGLAPQGATIRQEDAQRWACLWEMERHAIELLRHPAPDTFLGRKHNASILLRHGQQVTFKGGTEAAN
jgi:hypothetical protein